jgi:hypothetical protein
MMMPLLNGAIIATVIAMRRMPPRHTALGRGNLHRTPQCLLHLCPRLTLRRPQLFQRLPQLLLSLQVVLLPSPRLLHAWALHPRALEVARVIVKVVVTAILHVDLVSAPVGVTVGVAVGVGVEVAVGDAVDSATRSVDVIHRCHETILDLHRLRLRHCHLRTMATAVLPPPPRASALAHAHARAHARAHVRLCLHPRSDATLDHDPIRVHAPSRHHRIDTTLATTLVSAAIDTDGPAVLARVHWL